MHFSTYAGWVIMWWWLLSARGRRVSQTASNWIILGGAVYAGFDELTQALVERHPEVGDFLLDVFGVLIASSICQLWQRSFWLRRSRQGRQA
jgi:VanZ family protein